MAINSKLFDQKLWYFDLNAIKISDDSKFRSTMTIVTCVKYENSYAFLDINLLI